MASSEERARAWLLGGGGGFEGTPEAVTFSFIGAVDLLAAYEGEVRESCARQLEMVAQQIGDGNMQINAVDKLVYCVLRERAEAIRKGGA